VAKRPLDIILGARDRTGGTLAKVQAKMSRFSRRAAAMGIAAGALAAAGIATLVNRERQAIDVTAKLSARTGVSTEELIGFQKAAELTGAGTKLLNSSLDVMNKRIGEASGGVGQSPFLRLCNFGENPIVFARVDG